MLRFNVRSRVSEHDTQTHRHTHTLSFSAKPSPDPNKRAHQISKSLGGRILPLHALQGVTHKVLPPWEPISLSCLRVWKVRGLRVCVRYKWSHNVIPCLFLKILRVCEMVGAIHGVINLNSFFLKSDYQHSVMMTSKQHQGNWCISTIISSFKRWLFCFSLSWWLVISTIDFRFHWSSLKHFMV